MLPNLSNLSYPERLKKLNLPSLRYRRLRGDMIEVFKIVKGIYDKRVAGDIFELASESTTRGHQYKITKHRSRSEQRKNYFTNRIVDIWNNLPASVVSAKSVKSFENRLDNHWEDHPMKYDHEQCHQTGIRVRASYFNSDPNIEEEAELLRSGTT